MQLQRLIRWTATPAVLATTIFAASAAAKADQPKKTMTVVAFGDSTTAPRSTVKEVYADRLPKLLAKHGIQAKVINAGVGGSHTGRLADNARHKRRHALDRFDEVREHKPDVVVIQFGWNDSWIDSNKPDGPSRIPLEKYVSNLKQMMTTLKKDGAEVILMTPNQPRGSVEGWRRKRTEQYVVAVRKLAEAESATLIDVWKEYADRRAKNADSADALLLDAVHPNDQGHALVAELLAPAITKAR